MASAAGLLIHGACAAADEKPPVRTTANLVQLSIEELADIEIQSVSRRPERVSDAAASIYVITADEIRRLGAITLPEILRLAPNLQVARVNASSYAISARGFNSASANKLLVMIDGRSVYTPLHAGVFWDVQDVPITDIDHIEVVSGPGGTLWGANAVNGVINIITRAATHTVGTLVGTALGNGERGISARHGWAIGRDAAMRIYARDFRFENSVGATGEPVADAWNRRQAGMRADWRSRSSIWTLQGDAYDGTAQVPGSADRRVSGGNLLLRYTRDLGPESGVQVQAYADHTRRNQPGVFGEQLDTLDLDIQHHATVGRRHELVWGGGVRRQHDRTSGSSVLAFVPADNRFSLWNLFVQDTLRIGTRTRLSLGMKAEHNDYTGTEVQPNVRIAWKRNEQSLWWASISRAMRVPSRLDRDLQVFVDLPPPYGAPLLSGSRFVSERVTAYELGYRGQPSSRLSYSASAYVNDYARLRSIERGPPGAGYVLGNGIQGRTAGLEAWGSYQLRPAWRVSAGLNFIRERLSFDASSQDPGSPGAGANDPPRQFTLRSSWTLRRGVTVDVGVRGVAALPAPAVPGYVAVDGRLGWALSRDLQLALVGFNLLDAHHPEFGAANQRSEVPRTISLRLLWSL